MSNKLIGNKYTSIAIEIQEIFYLVKKPTYYEETQAIVAVFEKYIMPIEKETAELKERLNYIQNSSGEMFIPPVDSTNRGED